MKEQLKILQSAPIDIEVSPILKYAGTERIIDNLNRGYSSSGHISYVAASGDSDLGNYGFLLSTIEKCLWATNNSGLERTMVRSKEAYSNHYEKILNFAEEKSINIIHDHPGQFLVSFDEYLLQRDKIKIPIVTTIHEDISKAKIEKYDLFRRLQEENLPVYFIAISKSHKETYENFVDFRIDDFIYNGVDLNRLSFKDKKQDYLFWIGRVSDIKGADLAIEIAKKSKRPLILAGEVHTPDKKMYNEKVEPFLTNKITSEDIRNDFLLGIETEQRKMKEGEVIFVGPVDDNQKSILYKNAYTTLVPGRWNEPFGLVPVESMATGTPVICTNLGAFPELVLEGKSGFIIESKNNQSVCDEAIIENSLEALKKIKEISSLDCRAHIENKFSKEVMVKNYLDFYYKILNGTGSF